MLCKWTLDQVLVAGTLNKVEGVTDCHALMTWTARDRRVYRLGIWLSTCHTLEEPNDRTTGSGMCPEVFGARNLDSELHGGVAQLEEHLLCKQGVRGSSPLVSTRSLSDGLMRQMAIGLQKQQTNLAWWQ